MRTFKFVCIGMLVGILHVGCLRPEDTPEPPLDMAVSDLGTEVCTDPDGDWDKDGIPNGLESCLKRQDTDQDGTPDWQDTDSDDDGISDEIEKGTKTSAGMCASTKAPRNGWPCDTDGDGMPDYLDTDSDGDGMLDKDEDFNGDGVLGCCLATCGSMTSAQKKTCTLGSDGCGPGQTCVSSKCKPAVAFNCSDGETSPVKKDTFGDGKMDSARGTFICRDATEDKPGRKKVALKTSAESKGDWNLALESTAKYAELTIAGAASPQAAGVVDLTAGNQEVAGFVVSLPASSNQMATELSAVIALLSGSSLGYATVIASGSTGKSHDKYDTATGTTLGITTSSATSVSDLRNKVVAALLKKNTGDLQPLPSAYGISATEFIVRFTTVRRYAFKKDSKGALVLDSKGYPIDDGNAAKWRLMVVGALASKIMYNDPKQDTGILVEDLSNGTALATAADTVTKECDVGTVKQQPVADIIWVVDGSSSMSDNRTDVATHAATFFAQAQSSWLDFRMAVMPGCGYTQFQVFCKDRFLNPTEAATFSYCIDNPGINCECEEGLKSVVQGVTTHLPRAANDPQKIRTDAQLVIIQVTDSVPKSAATAAGNLDQCVLDTSTSTKLDQFLQQYKDLFSGTTNPEATAIVYGIAGVCNNSCGAVISHGYMEMIQTTGGQVADICQKNLGNSLQSIIDSIVAGSSPAVLDTVPISTSLAVSVDSKVAMRSRTKGFDYRSASNALVFIGTQVKQGSEYVASYNRWTRQVSIK